MELIHGDCLQVLPTLQPSSVDLVFADLPYLKTPAAKWDMPVDLPTLWAELHRVCKPTAPMVFTAVTPFNAHLMMSNLAEFRYDWVWEKNRGGGGMNAAYQPIRVHEHVLVFYRKRGTYHPQKTFGHKKYGGFSADDKNLGEIYGSLKSVHKGSQDGSRYPRTVQRWDMDRGHHPVQKPVKMMEYLLHTYTDPGDVVLDPTMGSGSMGVACRNLGRQFVGIELDPTHYATARERCCD